MWKAQNPKWSGVGLGGGTGICALHNDNSKLIVQCWYRHKCSMSFVSYGDQLQLDVVGLLGRYRQINVQC